MAQRHAALRYVNSKIRAITMYNSDDLKLNTPHPAAAGRGSLDPTIVFVGEALGEDEEKQRLPFVGRAGQILDECLIASDLISVRHYITNVVKVRPIIRENGYVKNRPPTEDEVGFWEPFLLREIEILKPMVLVGLGAVASAWLLGWPRENLKMGKIHGNMTLDAYLRAGVPCARIMPSYHPAATFHNPEVKDMIINDFKALRTFLRTAHRKNEGWSD